MKMKTIITGILLLFVGISIAYLVIGESQRVRTAEEPPAQTVEVLPAQAVVEPTREERAIDNTPEQRKEPERQVIAYYFHGNQRCVTCRTIEANAEESLRAGFSGELEAGKLVWRPVNVDAPENEHFVGDYELSTRSVILAEMLDGEQKQWKNLSRVWELARDKPSFIAYVQEETREFMGD